MQTIGEGFSLYFHVPFCTRKCPYCNFYILPDKTYFKEQYLEGIKKEWELKREFLPKDLPLVSIYFGGGTPSLLSPRELESILSLIPNIPKKAEITLEANPENLTESLLKDFHSIGVNRLSIGIQSLNDEELSTLHRTHNALKAKETVFAAHTAGFENISIDLMYDLPHQSLERWSDSLKQALLLPITHLSLYNLTLEPHTLFFKKQKEIAPLMPNEEVSLALLNQAIDMTEKKGFERYEISAFAKPGFYSRHNAGYWAGRPFLGFGPSAFSYLNGKRFQTIPHFLRWIKKLDRSENPTDFEETLSLEERQKELLTVHLRLLKGFSLATFENKWGKLPFSILALLRQWEEEKLLTMKEGALSLTRKGALFYDSLASSILALEN